MVTKEGMLGKGNEVIARHAPSSPFVEDDTMGSDKPGWSYRMIEEVVVNLGSCQMSPRVATSDKKQGCYLSLNMACNAGGDFLNYL